MIGLISVTAGGRAAAERLAAVLPYAQLYDGSAASALPQAFAECDAIISFLAVGATVRIVAPLITGKYEDPGIVCVDEALRYAIPVLGGHAGGANVLARRVAAILGATTVITTAAEAAGSVGLDEFGADLGFVVEPAERDGPGRRRDPLWRAGHADDGAAVAGSAAAPERGADAAARTWRPGHRGQ